MMSANGGVLALLVALSVLRTADTQLTCGQDGLLFALQCANSDIADLDNLLVACGGQKSLTCTGTVSSSNCAAVTPLQKMYVEFTGEADSSVFCSGGFLTTLHYNNLADCQQDLKVYNDALDSFAQGAFRFCSLTTATSTATSSVTSSQTATKTSTISSTASTTMSSSMSSSMSSTDTTSATSSVTSTQTTSMSSSVTSTMTTSGSSTITSTVTTGNVLGDLECVLHGGKYILAPKTDFECRISSRELNEVLVICDDKFEDSFGSGYQSLSGDAIVTTCIKNSNGTFLGDFDIDAKSSTDSDSAACDRSQTLMKEMLIEFTSKGSVTSAERQFWSSQFSKFQCGTDAIYIIDEIEACQTIAETLSAAISQHRQDEFVRCDVSSATSTQTSSISSTITSSISSTLSSTASSSATSSITTSVSSSATSSASSTMSTTVSSTDTSSHTSSVTSTATSSLSSTPSSTPSYTQSSTQSSTMPTSVSSSVSSTISTTETSTETSTITTTVTTTVFQALQSDCSIGGQGFIRVNPGSNTSVLLNTLNEALGECEDNKVFGFNPAPNEKFQAFQVFHPTDEIFLLQVSSCAFIPDLNNMLEEFRRRGLNEEPLMAKFTCGNNGLLNLDCLQQEDLVTFNTILDSFVEGRFRNCEFTTQTTTGSSTLSSTVSSSVSTSASSSQSTTATSTVTTIVPGRLTCALVNSRYAVAAPDIDKIQEQAAILNDVLRECTSPPSKLPLFKDSLSFDDSELLVGLPTSNCSATAGLLNFMIGVYERNGGASSFDAGNLECVDSHFSKSTETECEKNVNILNNAILDVGLQAFHECHFTTETTTVTSTYSSTATSSVSSTATSTVTSSASTSVSSTPTTSQSSTVTSSVSSTLLSTVSSTHTSSASSTASSSVSSSATSSVSSTRTSSVTSSITSTVSSSQTSSQTSTQTTTGSSSVSSTATSSVSSTLSSTLSSTITSTISSTATSSLSSTASSSVTSTQTSSVSTSVTSSQTSTQTSSASSSVSSTAFTSATTSATSSVTSTGTSTQSTTVSSTQSTSETSTMTSTATTSVSSSQSSSVSTTVTSTQSSTQTTSVSSTITSTASTSFTSSASSSVSTSATSTQSASATSSITTSITSTLTSSMSSSISSTVSSSISSSITSTATSSVSTTPSSTASSTVSSTMSSTVSSTVSSSATSSQTSTATTSATTSATTTPTTTTTTSTMTSSTLSSSTSSSSSSSTSLTTSSTVNPTAVDINFAVPCTEVDFIEFGNAFNETLEENEITPDMLFKEPIYTCGSTIAKVTMVDEQHARALRRIVDAGGFIVSVNNSTYVGFLTPIPTIPCSGIYLGSSVFELPPLDYPSLQVFGVDNTTLIFPTEITEITTSVTNSLEDYIQDNQVLGSVCAAIRVPTQGTELILDVLVQDADIQNIQALTTLITNAIQSQVISFNSRNGQQVQLETFASLLPVATVTNAVTEVATDKPNSTTPSNIINIDDDDEDEFESNLLFVFIAVVVVFFLCLVFLVSRGSSSEDDDDDKGIQSKNNIWPDEGLVHNQDFTYVPKEVTSPNYISIGDDTPAPPLEPVDNGHYYPGANNMEQTSVLHPPKISAVGDMVANYESGRVGKAKTRINPGLVNAQYKPSEDMQQTNSYWDRLQGAGTENANHEFEDVTHALTTVTEHDHAENTWTTSANQNEESFPTLNSNQDPGYAFPASSSADEDSVKDVEETDKEVEFRPPKASFANY
eukprot:m.37407 g.37407  ORF g.37407 m.37407 type:complete len:1728 (-) comp9311_c0_seq2:98-5281(-)